MLKFVYNILLLRYWGYNLELQHVLTIFWRIVEQNGLKWVPHGRFGKIYCFEKKNQNFSTTLPLVQFFFFFDFFGNSAQQT